MGQNLQERLRRNAVLLVRIASLQKVGLRQKVAALRIQVNRRHALAAYHCLFELRLRRERRVSRRSLPQSNVFRIARLVPLGKDSPVTVADWRAPRGLTKNS